MKQSKKGILIIIACICVALAGGGIFAFARWKNSPQRRMLNAATRLSGAITAAAGEEGQPDLNRLMSLYTSGKFAASYNATVRNSFYTEDTVIEGKSLYSTPDRQMKSDSEVDMNTFGKVKVQLYADDQKIYMLYPDWMEGSIIFPIAQYDKNLFQTPPVEMADATEITTGIQDHVIALMLVSEVEAVGKETGSYQVTLDKKKLEEAFGGKAEVKEDVTLSVSVEGEDHITSISNEMSPLELKGIGDTVLHMTFDWEDENVTSMKVTAKADKLSMDYTYTYADAKCDLTAEYEQLGTMTKIAFAGKVKTEKDSDEITLNIDSFKTYVEEDLLLSLDGLVILSPLEETIEKPEHLEPEFDLMHMTTDDYAKLYGMLGDKLLNFLK